MSEPAPQFATSPLADVTVLEIGGMGAIPHLGMLLADLGAQVVKFLAPANGPSLQDVTDRSKLVSKVDLKSTIGRDLAFEVIDRADIVIEGFRPGVLERLDLSPELLLARRPTLVIGRLTGWGTAGPYASLGGHDINYIGLAGALHAIGPDIGGPVPPLNLLGDFAGGAQLLCIGLLAALHEVQHTGRGQTVVGSMIAGTAHLMASTYGMIGAGNWTDQRAVNLLDGGCPYYRAYECADERFVAVGAIEAKFFDEVIELVGLDPDTPAVRGRLDRANWPQLHEMLAAAFRGRDRDAWCRDAIGKDACVTPVLSMSEAPHHPQMSANSSFVELDGVKQPAPHPIFAQQPLPAPRAARRVDCSQLLTVLDEQPALAKGSQA